MINLVHNHLLKLITRSSLILAGACLCSVAMAQQNLIKNPTFTEGTPGAMPANWSGFPSGDGLEMVAGGGLQVNDASESKGLGAIQWLPAQAGATYTISATFEGTGGLFIYMNFTSGIPNQASKMKQATLLQKRKWFKALPAGSEPISFSATAPAGTTNVRVWIYSPGSGTTNVICKDIKLTATPPAAQ